MKLFAYSLLEELTAKAGASVRRRAHHNVHAGPADAVQRFFVAANHDAYFRPHRHSARSEMALVLRGCFAVLTFDESGRLAARYAVGSGTQNMGWEVPQATWHTLIALQDGSAFLEIKQGPYDPATASQFAAWAPAEGDAAVPGFLQRLRSAGVGAQLALG
ncbi:MAG: WbuC family cupin fold metalloprotein [Steroidobacteraceae bacterium]